jgi:hypothetical protein
MKKIQVAPLRSVINSLVLMLALNFVPISATWAGGPWNQSAGHGYSQIGFSYIRYTQMFNGADQENPYSLNREVTDITLQGYLEYGLSDRWNLIGTLPVKFTSTDEKILDAGENPSTSDTLPAGSLNGLGNISAALRYQILSEPFALAARFTAEANTIQSDETTGLATGFDAWSFKPAIDAGISGERWYAFSEIGLGLRTSDYPALFLFSLEGGYSFFDSKTFLVGVVDFNLTIGTEDSDPISPPSQAATGMYLSDQEFISYGIKILQSISPHWWVNAGINGAMYGNLVANSPAYNLSLAYKW